MLYKFMVFFLNNIGTNAYTWTISVPVQEAIRIIGYNQEDDNWTLGNERKNRRIVIPAMFMVGAVRKPLLLQ